MVAHHHKFWLALVLILSGSTPLAWSAEGDAADQELARQAVRILDSRCRKCHHVEQKVPGLDVLDPRSLEEGGYLVPKDLAGSGLWDRVGVTLDMPPKKAGGPLPPEEIEILQKWILAGALFPEAQAPRPFISEKDILTTIRNFLLNQVKSDRQNLRFFSLAHVSNNKRVTNEEMKLYRAAFSKVLNSLTRRPEIIIAPSIDPQQTIFVVDLRRLGWNLSSQWTELLKQYPYGYSHNPNAERLSEIEEEIDDMTSNGIVSDGISYLRADWFVAKASRPPLYHVLLSLPDTEQALATQLGLNFEGDFLNNSLQRAGFSNSGVSRNNRLVDRHVGTNTAYYYRSHDFGKSFGRGVLFRFPLGPKFTNNPFNDQAYEQDGGEVVFSLPNGMQGYLIVDKDGKRIDVAPTEVVRDPSEFAGSVAVVNGVSCMCCHKEGVKPFKDDVRDAFVLGGEARQKVLTIYKSESEFKQLQQQDSSRHEFALKAAIGPYLLTGDDAQKDPLKDFPEPVSRLVNYHEGPVTPEVATSELFLEDVNLLTSAIKSNLALQQMGLGPLTLGSPVPRAMWDTDEDQGASVFQATARQLKNVIPVNQN